MSFKIPPLKVSSLDEIVNYFSLVMNKWSGSILNATAVKDIGIWDMDSTGSVVVPFALDVSIKQISSINVIIINDSQNEVYDLGLSGEAVVSCKYDDVNGVTITRTTNGLFDNSNFNDSINNRGRIKICYTV